jgi:response regulator of citrate/malate metabolism
LSKCRTAERLDIIHTVGTAIEKEGREGEKREKEVIEEATIDRTTEVTEQDTDDQKVPEGIEQTTGEAVVAKFTLGIRVRLTRSLIN